jgi:hypothetical protein
MMQDVHERSMVFIVTAHHHITYSPSHTHPHFYGHRDYDSFLNYIPKEKAILEVMFANMEEKLELGKAACNDLLKYVKELARSQHEFVRSFGKLGNALDERLHYGYGREIK